MPRPGTPRIAGRARKPPIPQEQQKIMAVCHPDHTGSSPELAESVKDALYQIYIDQEDNNMTKIKKLLIHSNLPSRNSGLFRHPSPCLYLLYYEHKLYEYQQLEHNRFAFLGIWKTASLFIHKHQFSHNILFL